MSMALQRDWILDLIERLAEALGRLARGESTEDEAESQLEALTGLSLERIDAMPAALLIRVLMVGERGPARVEALASALEVLAAHGDPQRSQARSVKAAALRSRLP